MQLIGIFAFLLLMSECELSSSNKDLYIIADRRQSSYIGYPEIYSLYGKICDVCYKHKAIVPYLNPFCFAVDGDKSIQITTVETIKPEIWDYATFEKYIHQNYDVFSEGCGKLFKDYEKVYILIENENGYEKIKVLKCYTFEI